jgi:hypothetical protein
MSAQGMTVFDSFFFAGFEGTAGWNRAGQWIDQIAATQHDVFVADDYARLREVGLLGCRESVRWPLVDRAGRHDFSSVLPFARASREQRMPVLWDLFHFGYPADVDLFSDAMPARFAEYCHAATRFLASELDGPLALIPMNEPSYFAWAAGDEALFAPHVRGRGAELKRQLARAAIAGARAILDACPDARLVSADAVCRVVPPHDQPERRAECERFNGVAVFESWDMIAGTREPALGGSRELLGTVGVNYYWTNQWELGAGGTPLPVDDPRRLPLGHILRGVFARYGGDLLITETSHVGDGRARWLTEVAEQAEAVLADGLPLRGVCLYPILGMPEWHEREVWTRMGLWDLVPQSPTLGRVLHEPMAAALADASRRLDQRA